MAANTQYSMFRGPAPTPTPAPTPARTPASVAKSKPKATPKANPKNTAPSPKAKPKVNYHNTTTTKTTTDTSTPTTPQNTLPLTDDQKWLKTHPDWKAKTAAKWKASHPNAQPTHRPGIEQTVIDANTLARAFRATPAAYDKSATDLANSMFNSAVSADELRPQDTAQRQQNVTNFGNELMKQLAGIALAGADQTQGNINLFKQGATAADQATSAQAVAAGGTTAPSTVDPAAVSLGNTGSNLLNAFAGRQTAAADQNRLFHQQESLNEKAGLDKLATQKKSDYATEYERQQTAGDARVSNGLTYNLYNQQNTTKSQLGNRSLTLQQRIAKQKAWAATADRSVREQQAQISADIAAGKLTGPASTLAKAKVSALQNVLNHQGGLAGGSLTYYIPVKWTTITQVKDPTGGPQHDGYLADGVTPATKPQPTEHHKVIAANAAQFQAFNASGPVGQRKLAQLGAAKGAVLNGTITHKATAGKSSGYTLAQAFAVLVRAGYTAGEANSVLQGYQG